MLAILRLPRCRSGFRGLADFPAGRGYLTSMETVACLSSFRHAILMPLEVCDFNFELPQFNLLGFDLIVERLAAVL